MFSIVNCPNSRIESYGYPFWSIKENDILSPKITYEAEFGFSRDTWNVETKSKLTVTCNEENFFLKGSIFGYENDTQVFTRSWDIAIPRVVF